MLGGVIIGEESVVATRSVVTKDIPSYTILEGVITKGIGKISKGPFLF